MRRGLVLLLMGAFGALGLTACMSDDDGSASSRDSRRSAALISTGPGNPGGYQLTIDPITKSGQAIVVESYSWGVSNAGSAAAGGGAGAGKASFDVFKIVKGLDEVSPLLFKNAAQGTHFPKVTLTLAKAVSPVKYATYTLENVLISGVKFAGSNPDMPKEEVSFNFAKMTLEASSLDEKGGKPGVATTATYDLTDLAK